MKYFNANGYEMKATNGKLFTQCLRQTMKNTDKEYIFESFINDIDENDQVSYRSNIHVNNKFTEEYLKKLGFEWSDIDFEYIRRYVEYFKEIGYFK